MQTPNFLAFTRRHPFTSRVPLFKWIAFARFMVAKYKESKC